jgi:hypothetical protein
MRRSPRTFAVTLLFLVASGLASPLLAGDAFLKGGVIFYPRDVGFEGRWRASFGSDYPVNFHETVFVGFELLGSVYRQDVVGGGTATIIPGNAFVNVKYKSSSLGARPFAGGGLGLVGDVRFVSDETLWGKNFGFHLLGGVELGRLVLEFQLTASPDEEIDTEYSVWAGFVW